MENKEVNENILKTMPVGLLFIKMAVPAIFLTIWRKIILLIPLIFILPHFVADPTIGVFLAEPIADFIAVCTTGTLFYRYYRRKL